MIKLMLIGLVLMSNLLEATELSCSDLFDRNLTYTRFQRDSGPVTGFMQKLTFKKKILIDDSADPKINKASFMLPPHEKGTGVFTTEDKTLTVYYSKATLTDNSGEILFDDVVLCREISPERP